MATTAEILSTDAGNLLTVGSDGGTYLDLATIPVTETTTTLVDNGDGTFTYTNEDGIAVTIDSKGTLVDNGDGTFTFTDAAGTVVTWSETLTSLEQDNVTGNITYTDENGVATTAEILSTDVGNLLTVGSDGGTYLDLATIPVTETTTTLVDNGDGTFTYTNEDGIAVTIDSKGTLVDNGDGTFAIVHDVPLESMVTFPSDGISKGRRKVVVLRSHRGRYLTVGANCERYLPLWLRISAVVATPFSSETSPTPMMRPRGDRETSPTPMKMGWLPRQKSSPQMPVTCSQLAPTAGPGYHSRDRNHHHPGGQWRRYLALYKRRW